MKIITTFFMLMHICLIAQAQYYNCNVVSSTSIVSDPYYELNKQHGSFVKRLISFFSPSAKYSATSDVKTDPNSNLKFELTEGKAFIYRNSSKANLVSLRNNYFIEDTQSEILHFWKFFPATENAPTLLVHSKAYSFVSPVAFQTLYECRK